MVPFNNELSSQNILKKKRKVEKISPQLIIISSPLILDNLKRCVLEMCRFVSQSIFHHLCYSLSLSPFTRNPIKNILPRKSDGINFDDFQEVIENRFTLSSFVLFYFWMYKNNKQTKKKNNSYLVFGYLYFHLFVRS